MNTAIDMTLVVTKSAELHDDMTEVNRALKRVASVKCRLKKMPGRPTFNSEMTAALQEEELLKNVRAFLQGPRRNVNTLEPEDITKMSYEEVNRAIKAIQTKKTHTKWADDCLKDDKGLCIPGTGESFKEACRIEQLLKERREAIKPAMSEYIKRSTLYDYLDTLRFASDLDKMDIIECLDRIEAFLEGDK